jgi:uncharacterized phage protein gp47/JayE
MSLTPQGYVAKRADDYITDIQGEYERLTGLTFDWAREDVLRNLTVIFGRRLGAIDEVVQAVYDSRDRNNAKGIQLDTLLQLQGGQRQVATNSRVPGTITGDPGTNIPANRQIRGGGQAGNAIWRLLEDVTIPAAGSIVSTFEAVETGAITALAGEVSTIVTPVTGWTSVTNAVAATPGFDREDDGEVLDKILAEDARVGELSPPATREAIKEAVPAVKGVVVLNNITLAPVTIAARTIPARSMNVVVHPNTLTDDEKKDVLQAIYISSPPIQRIGTDVTGTVNAEDGTSVPIAFDWADELSVDVIVLVTLKPGFALADVMTLISDAIEAHVATLNVAESLTLLNINCLIANVEGVKAAVVTLNGTAADVDPSIIEIVTLSDVSVGVA